MASDMIDTFDPVNYWIIGHAGSFLFMMFQSSLATEL